MEIDKVAVIPADRLFSGFLDEKYITKGKDKFYLRNMQVHAPKDGWRHLTSDEIETLVKNDNTATSWDSIMVTNEFEPMVIKNNRFFGFIRIGRVTANGLQFHDLKLQCGIVNSSIYSCDIGDDVAIHNVHYLSHYIIGDRCMLFNIQEMSCTNHAKFGNGILKDGEEENVRTHIELMNEIGCRNILPFDGMIAADAYMWAKYVDDKQLQERLVFITQNSFDSRRGFYGTIGSDTVIKNSWILKDVKIGNDCYIKGASKLKNLTINSSEKESTQIGENVVLVNGIIGYGCRVFYSCIAVNFVLGSHSNLKYGARLINSFMGDNSTISCCEVLNNLLFPGHEQHHNNSFLIASVVKGQSNIAAGATLGSNHNSRSNDGEIEAGRGFWPGLCVSIKHTSKFASYTTISKADYPAEMVNPFPFALISNDQSNDELNIMPAFTWLYNMYSMARNAQKYAVRDARIYKTQNIEFDPYAPDSIEEVLYARTLLEEWTAKAYLKSEGGEEKNSTALRELGRRLLNGEESVVNSLEVFGENIEKGKRKVRILKVYKAYHAYKDIIVYYAVKNLVSYMESNPKETISSLVCKLNVPHRSDWVNLGGQLMLSEDLDRLRSDIRKGKIDSWQVIHERYNEIWKKYPMDKLCHAVSSLKMVLGDNKLNTYEGWMSVLDKGIDIQNYINDQVYESRKKDYTCSFRHSTCRNDQEFEAVFGRLEDNSFIQYTREETKSFIERIQILKKKVTI